MSKKIAVISSKTKDAQAAKKKLEGLYPTAPEAEADIIVALGGDGFMLETLHRTLPHCKPIFGMNRGTVGFLMNEYRPDGLMERLSNAKLHLLHPLRMKAGTKGGKSHQALAINEVALLRQTRLAAKIRIYVDGKVMMEELVADGVLRRHQGKGTYVTEQTPEAANFHFFRLVGGDGERVLPESRSEVVVTVRAGAAAARRLGVAEGDEIVVIERVRAIAGRPAILETVEVPAALMPGLEAETPLPNALYPHYQARHGVSVTSTEDRLSAVAADAAAAKALGVAEGTPLLLVERVAHDLSGRAVEWRRSRFLSGDLAYAVTLG